jgi:protein TonB
MNAKFILPGTFALTFHAFLLLGLPEKTPPVGFLPEAKQPTLGPSIPVDTDPPITEQKDIVDDPGPGGGGPVAPHLPEIPDIAPPSDAIAIPTILAAKGDPSITIIPPGWQNPGRSGDGAFTDTVGLDKLDRPPRARSQPAPCYPADLLRAGVEGVVEVEFLVDKEGNVHNPVVLRASHPEFIDPAIRAISRWRFEPSHSGGRRVRFRMSVPMMFTIEHR